MVRTVMGAVVPPAGYFQLPERLAQRPRSNSTEEKPMTLIERILQRLRDALIPAYVF
jgi:hypothetical protein